MVRQFEAGAAAGKEQNASEPAARAARGAMEEDASQGRGWWSRMVVQDVPSGCIVIEQSLCGSISAPVSRCHRCESALAAHFERVMKPLLHRFAGVSGASSLVAGAVGSHKLTLTSDERASWQTAVIFQGIHACATLALANSLHKRAGLIGAVFFGGSVLFSGSIYA